MNIPSYLRRPGLGHVSFAQGVALLFPVAFTAARDPEVFVLFLCVALIAALIWEALFAALRKQSYSLHGVTTGLIVSVLAPVDLNLWQLAMMVSLGVVFGELAFGGRGFGFLNAATVTLSLLIISFPEIRLQTPQTGIAIGSIAGAVLLVFLGLLSWRVLIGAGGGILLGWSLSGFPPEPAPVGIAVVFGLVFLIGDPISAASTSVGRWLYGALSGGLIVLFSQDGTPISHAVVFAALLASIFAPFIDHLVVLAHARRRSGGHHV